LDLATQPLDSRGIDDPGAEVLRRFGTAGDAEPQALDGGASAIPRCDIAGQESVPGADARPRLLLLDPQPVERRHPVFEHVRVAARRIRPERHLWAGSRRTLRCWRPWRGTAASRGTARARAPTPPGRVR